MNDQNSLFVAVVLGATCAVSMMQLQKIMQLREREIYLNTELDKQKQLREEERKARIGMQRQKRDEANNKDKNEGFHYQPIAFAESPFPDRRGTPRQPLLVPAARGLLRFQKNLVQLAHFKELEEFSHVWVLFVFHENTNTDKAHDNTSKQVLAKIKPPRLHGKKVGCLSTRSPHRPNNIGLSVCEIISIGNDYIEVRGIDLVHGTPIIDVKPYIPYDIVPSQYVLPMATTSDGQQLPLRSLQVPEWVVEADIPMKPVFFSPVAHQNMTSLFQFSKRRRSPHISRTCEEAMELIKQVLRQDIRSQHRGRGNISLTNTVAYMQQSNEVPAETEAQDSYSCTLDGMQLTFQHLEDGIWIESVQEANR